MLELFSGERGVVWYGGFAFPIHLAEIPIRVPRPVEIESASFVPNFEEFFLRGKLSEEIENEIPKEYLVVFQTRRLERFGKLLDGRLRHVGVRTFLFFNPRFPHSFHDLRKRIP